MQCVWFCCEAPVRPFPGITAKVGPALHSMAGFPHQIVLVCVFSALNKGLFLCYLLSAWDNSSKDRDKCGVSGTHSVASFCKHPVNIG